MRCFLLGTLRDIGVREPQTRAQLAYDKAKELGIQVISRDLTVGRFDFCTLIEAPNLAVASAFDHWYSAADLGDLEILVVHDDEDTEQLSRLLRGPAFQPAQEDLDPIPTAAP